MLQFCGFFGMCYAPAGRGGGPPWTPAPPPPTPPLTKALPFNYWVLLKKERKHRHVT